MAHGRLSVSLGRARIVEQLVLPGWALVTASPRAHTASTTAPAPSWSFGFSALAGSLSRDIYALDNVVLRRAHTPKPNLTLTPTRTPTRTPTVTPTLTPTPNPNPDPNPNPQAARCCAASTATRAPLEP